MTAAIVTASVTWLFVLARGSGHEVDREDVMSDATAGLTLRETWVVRHDSQPDPVEFVYRTEREAREAFERSGFYDPATGWGVTLIRRVRGSAVLATTKPTRRP